MSYKSDPQEYATRVSHKSVPQECPTRVSFGHMYIAFRPCLHSGSWAPSCFHVGGVGGVHIVSKRTLLFQVEPEINKIRFGVLNFSSLEHGC